MNRQSGMNYELIHNVWLSIRLNNLIARHNTSWTKKIKLTEGTPWQNMKVVYFCIIFKCMHSIFGIPGWRHTCILKKEGVSHFGLVFRWKDGDA